MNTVPYISIITSSYNAAKYLQKCIDSVAQQRFPHLEHLIADGASQDKTLEIIQNNAHKLSWWVSEPDNGIYHAWNKALRHARGKCICFLNADDWFCKMPVPVNYRHEADKISGDENEADKSLCFFSG